MIALSRRRGTYNLVFIRLKKTAQSECRVEAKFPDASALFICSPAEPRPLLPRREPVRHVLTLEQAPLLAGPEEVLDAGRST